MESEGVSDSESNVARLEAAVAAAIGTQRYDLWFRSHARFFVDSQPTIKSLRIAIRSTHLLEWLTSTFEADVRSAAQKLFGTIEIVYYVDTALFAAADSKPTPEATAKPKLNLFGEAITPKEDAKPVRKIEAPKPTRRFRSLNDFVVGACNRVAHAACQSIVEDPSQASNPTVIYGPVGVGKTHLLEGIYAGIRRSDPTSRPVFVTAEDFTTRAVQSMRFGKMPAFRSRFREASALIVDDLHFLAKKSATQEEFLYTFDALVADHRPVIVAMDCHPRLADELMPELVDRLLGGMAWSLMPPDDETRLALLRSKAISSGPLAFPQEVLMFLARNLKGNVRELEGAIAAIRHFARVANRPIDISIAREAAGDLLRHSVRSISLDDIEAAVYRALNLPKGTLQSASKSWAVTHPRMAAIFLARKHTAATYGEIAKHFGVRQHSTAVAAEKRVRNWLTKNERVNVGGQEWPALDLLSRIERELGK
jgi:chromosomal replication initiator protein